MYVGSKEVNDTVYAATTQRRTSCPYGWMCPAHLMLQKHNNSNVRTINAYPLFKSKSRCYICKGLLRGEFQLFITIRPAPWAVTSSDLALKLLAKVMDELASVANMLDLKAVFVLATGKIVVRNGRYFERLEVPHVHILVGAKRRIGRFRVSRRDRVRKLVEFSRQWVEQCYVDAFKGLYPKCIDIKWIKYDVSSKSRKTKRKKRRELKKGKGKFRLRTYMFKQLVPKGYKPIAVGIHLRRRHKTPSTDDKTLYSNSIRAYDYAFENRAGGMGGYWGSASRRDEELSYGDVARLLAKLYSDLGKDVFMDLQLRSRILRSSLAKLVRTLLERVRTHSMEPQDIVRYLYAMYSLADVWKEMSEVVGAVDEELSDATVEEVVKNYSIRLPNLIGIIIWLSRIDADASKHLLHYILKSMKMRLERSLNNGITYGVEGLLGLL